MNEFFHSGAMGDIVYALPAIISSGGGKLNLVKKKHYKSLKKLLSLQPNIEVAFGCSGVSLDGYRAINDNKKHLAQCHLDLLNVSFDLTQKWIFNIEPIETLPIVINKTMRYHDRYKDSIDWNILTEYSDKILFIGYKEEYEFFKKTISSSVHMYKRCCDALEIAQIIKGSKIFIGNQSLAFALAEAMKHPRVLEVCHKYDNCRPSGSDGYVELTKGIIEKCLSV